MRAALGSKGVPQWRPRHSLMSHDGTGHKSSAMIYGPSPSSRAKRSLFSVTKFLKTSPHKKCSEIMRHSIKHPTSDIIALFVSGLDRVRNSDWDFHCNGWRLFRTSL
jgi:hypothetical protein